MILNIQCPWPPPRGRNYPLGDNVTKISIHGLNLSLYDWVPANKNNPKDSIQEFVEGLWTMDHKVYQTDLWKLGVGLGTFFTFSKGSKQLQLGGLTACVPESYALLVGNVTINAHDFVYNVSCEKCNLTNCVTSVEDNTKVVILYLKPALTMVPVNILYHP